MDYQTVLEKLENATKPGPEKEKDHSASLDSVLSAFIPTLTTGLIFVTIFALIRSRYPNFYAPRTLMGTIPKKHRINDDNRSFFNWITIMCKLPDKHLLYHQSMDSYLFLRFLRTTIFICLVGCFLTWPILMPINAAGGGNSSQLDKIGIGNVKKIEYLFAHAIIACVFLLFVLFTIARERLWLIGLRQAWAFSKNNTSRLSSRTVLFLSAPRAAFEEINMKLFFGDSAVRIWPATKMAAVDALIEDEKSLLEELEVAESTLIKRAYGKATKHAKSTAQDANEPTYHALSRETRKGIRPTRHSSYPLVGNKVDAIQWLRERINDKRSEIEELRRNYKPGSNGGGAVFVEFKTMAEAQRAVQQIASADALALYPRFLGVSPKDVLWQNLSLPPERRISQEGIAMAAVVALIIFWSIPSGFVGTASNITYLAEHFRWLAWLNNLPGFVIGVLSGLLPPLLTSLLSKYVPTIFRYIFAGAGAPTTTANELHVQKWYYIFQVTQVFFVTAVFSSGATVFTELVDRAKRPASIPGLLAKQLPKSSNYYLTYFIVQGLSTAAGNLLNWTDLLQYLSSAWLFDKTPRQKFARYTSMKGIAWGKAFPKLTNFAIIAIVYSCIAPLVLGFAAAGLFFNYLAYRYNLLFVIQPKIDTKGEAYVLALQHLLTGVYISELALFGLFGLLGAAGPASMMAVLGLITLTYNTLTNRYLSPLEKYLPTDLVNQHAAEEESAPLLASAEEGRIDEEPQSHITQLGEQARIPRKLIHPLARFFEPKVFTSYQAMKAWLRKDADGFQDYEDDAPSYNAEQVKKAYLSPALTSSMQVIWLPKDKTGASKDEVSQNQMAGLKASDEGAWIDEKGRVQWNEANFERVPIWKPPVQY